VIESITAAPVQSGTLTQAVASDEELGRDAFLKLLLTQLQHQDPLDPVQNEDFVAQLAQFSSLEQLQSINNTLSSEEEAAATTEVRQAVQNNTAVALIGKEVEVATDTIGFTGSGSVELNFHLEAPATHVNLHIVDGQGDVVRSLTESNPDVGEGSVVWDGKDADGRLVPAGVYNVLALAENGEGDTVPVSASLVGEVTGVRYESGEPVLILEGGEAPLSWVSSVSQGS